METKDNTIRWFKVKCSFYKQELGIKHWCDVIDFMSKNVCFDFVITGQTTEPYMGVEGYYENGVIYPNYI